MKITNRKELLRRLFDGPTHEDDPLYERIQHLGFRVEGDWIVNPFWSVCGRFKISPLEEYGTLFLNSLIAKVLGYRIPIISLPPSPIMPAAQRQAHELWLMKRIKRTTTSKKEKNSTNEG